MTEPNKNMDILKSSYIKDEIIRERLYSKQSDAQLQSIYKKISEISSSAQKVQFLNATPMNDKPMEIEELQKLLEK